MRRVKTQTKLYIIIFALFLHLKVILHFKTDPFIFRGFWKVMIETVFKIKIKNIMRGNGDIICANVSLGT